MPSQVFPKDLLDLSKRFVSHREGMSTEEVVVLTDPDAFARYVSQLHATMEDAWTDTHQGAELPVSSNELYRYCITALESRVKYVRHERPVVKGNDQWYLPAPVAMILSMLGTVDTEAPVRRVIPKWNSELDAHLLSYQEWTDISMRLRRVELDNDAKILLVHAIEKDRRGDEHLMSLVPQLAENGNVAHLRHNVREVDPIVATTFLILSLRPELVVGPVLTDAERRLLPFHQPASISDIITMVMAQVKGKSA
jgi:hypothetical protein